MNFPEEHVPIRRVVSGVGKYFSATAIQVGRKPRKQQWGKIK